MSQDLMNRLQQLKKQEAEAKQNLDRLAGRRDQLVSTLKKEFNCNSIAEAESKLEKLETDVERRKERAEKLLADIENAVKEK